MKISNQEKRLAWSTPELQRIDAGSAEASNSVEDKNDNGTNPNNKS